MVIRIRLVDATNGTEQEGIFPDDEAIELLSGGGAQLAVNQPEAPLKPLEWLKQRLGGIDCFGPAVLEPSLLAHANEVLISGGARQSIAEGHHVRWIKGSQLTDEARAKLFAHTPSCIRLYRELKRALNAQLRDRVSKVSMPPLASKEQERHHFIPASSGNFMSGHQNYFQVSEDWFAFHKQFGQLRKNIKDLVRSAVAEGRLLCSERVGGSDVLLHPSETIAERFQLTSKDKHYVFCDELPPTWFEAKKSLHQLRNEASTWMVKASRHFLEQGRRVTRKDLIAAAMIRLDLSENAATDAWKKVSTSVNLPSGNVPEDQRVSPEELRDFQ